jgi:hypothetical protein
MFVTSMVTDPPVGWSTAPITTMLASPARSALCGGCLAVALRIACVRQR